MHDHINRPERGRDRLILPAMAAAAAPTSRAIKARGKSPTASWARALAFVSSIVMLAAITVTVQTEVYGQAQPERQSANAGRERRVSRLRQQRDEKLKENKGEQQGGGVAQQQSGTDAGGEQPKPAPPPKPKKSVWSLLFNPIVIIALVFIAFHLYRTRLRMGTRHKTRAHLATKEEQSDIYGTGWGQGGYLLGREVKPTVMGTSKPGKQLRLPLEARCNHILIEAGPGAGKTTGYFIPQMYEDAATGRVNVYTVDRKSPELFFQLAKPWRDQGHKAILFDPFQPHLTAGFEPLWGADNDQIEALVEVHISVELDPNSPLRHYRDMESRVLRTVFHAAQAQGRCKGVGVGVKCECEHSPQAHAEGRAKDCRCLCRRHICTLPAVARILALGWEATKAFIESGRPDLNVELSNMWAMAPFKLTELFVGLATKLEVYRQPGPAAAFSRSDFTMKDVVTPIDRAIASRVLLVVGASQSDGQHASLVASLMTQMLAKEMFRRRNKMAMLGLKSTSPEVAPVIAYLDELGTYAVPGLDDLIATARSGACSIVMAFQNREQLTEHYGINAVPRIVTSARTHVILRGVHPDVAEEISEACGKIIQYDEIDSKGSSGRGIGGRTFMRNRQARPIEVPLIRIDDVLTLPPDQAFVIGPTSPTRVFIQRYFEDPSLKQAVEQSEEETRMRARANQTADSENRKRPAGEPRRLRAAKFTWDCIPAVTDALNRKPGDEKPMNREMKHKLSGKLQALGLESDRDAICYRLFRRPFAQLTKGDAEGLLEHLLDIEGGRIESPDADAA